MSLESTNKDSNKVKKPITGIYLDRDRVDQENMFDVWYHLSSSLFYSYPTTSTQDFVFRSNCYHVEDLIFTNVHFDNLLFERTNHQISVDTSNFLVLQYYQQGQQTGLVRVC